MLPMLKIGDQMRFLKDDAYGAKGEKAGNIVTVVYVDIAGLYFRTSISPGLLYSSEWGFEVKNLGDGIEIVSAFNTNTGVKVMKKSVWRVVALEHKPVPGIPETIPDIETKIVYGPENVLASSADKAKLIATQELSKDVNVDYVEIIANPF